MDGITGAWSTGEYVNVAGNDQPTYITAHHEYGWPHHRHHLQRGAEVRRGGTTPS